MDIVARGLIEKQLDYISEEQDILETVSWILDVDDEVINREDLALGYFLGALMNSAYKTVEGIKFMQKSDKMLQRKLGEIEAGKSIKEKEERVKTYRPVRVRITEQEKAEIRGMLIRRIKPFRLKIRTEPFK